MADSPLLPSSSCQEPSLRPSAEAGEPCGAAVTADGRCLAHLDPNALDAHLAELTPGAPVHARGVVFSAGLLQRLTAVLRLPDGTGSIGDADFNGATFAELASFTGVTFTGRADFAGATFAGVAFFAGATFTRGVFCRKATFADGAHFAGAHFTEVANFGDVTFTKVANFGDVTFTGVANFAGASFAEISYFVGAAFTDALLFRDATFSGDSNFSGATFATDAYFHQLTFQAASFSGATFSRDADFSDTTFAGTADFSGAAFTGTGDFGGVAFGGTAHLRGPAARLNLERAEVSGELVVEGPIAELSVVGMRSSGRVALRLRGTEVDVEDAVFTGPFTMHGLQHPEEGVDEAHLPVTGSGGVRPVAVVSLRGMDAERLVLTDVDLSRCRFTGIHRLDQIKFDGRCVFATDPSGARQVLVEEHHWRHDQQSRRAERWTAAPDGVEVVGPDRLQVLYRQLRKAFEEGKNEPGAADFYYGEMEMRRAVMRDNLRREGLLAIVQRGRRPDRWILNAYWATSGYALRARRALICLAGVVAATIVTLTLWGFPATGKDLKADGTLSATGTGTVQPIRVTVHQSEPTEQLSDRIEKATEITLNAVIFRAPDTELTTTGRYVDITARILGPLFLGFSVLAVRNRVKR
ncbi:pentapeptide repeat-containing protein [Actinomadura scrupuli]|uniref:pentapeptide repeat-containing protein n=1 Tax=Actinomadura scrupuli TaxID=559629 RepID=UPI003D96417D